METGVIAEAIYIACALTSIGCAWLLIRGYRLSGTRLLFWAALCFVGLTVDNVLLYVDLVLEPKADLFYFRTVPAAAGLIVLAFGLIHEAR
jgi:Family of unknown function (DUF5985)